MIASSKRVYLKIVLGDWRNASRDRRELGVACEAGYNVIVMASTKEDNEIKHEKDGDYSIIRIPTRMYGKGKISRKLGHIAGLFLYIHEVKRIKADVISGHNFGGLLVGYIGNRNKAKLIYDSHEYELFQDIKRSFVKRILVRATEGFLLKRADISIMVSDTIAEKIEKAYLLKNRPIVIRNVPLKTTLDINRTRSHREDFLMHLNIKADGFIMMYHGGIAPGRGLEQGIEALSRTKDTGLVVMGYALEEVYMKSIEQLIKNYGVESRVYIIDAVSPEKVVEYVSAADVGLVLIQNTCLSFYYSLPNKLFEDIQGTTPVLVSDFPEMGRIINEYNVGIKMDPANVDLLVEAIDRLVSDKALYSMYKKNCEIARNELCWQVEKNKLLSEIESLFVG